MLKTIGDFVFDFEMTKAFETAEKILKEKDLKVIALFLCGSQNYGLSDEKSDIDLKAIVVPSFKDFLTTKSPASFKTPYPYGEIDVKDVRLMEEAWRKQHINYVEILFTKWVMVDSNYEKVFKKLFKEKERIAHYDPIKTLKCALGTIRTKEKHLWSPDRAAYDEEKGYDPKCLYHITRIDHFIDSYIKGKPYNECLTAVADSARDVILEMKRGKSDLPIETIKKSVEKTIFESESKIDSFVSSFTEFITFYAPYWDEKVDLTLKTFVEEVMEKVIKEIAKDLGRR